MGNSAEGGASQGDRRRRLGWPSQPPQTEERSCRGRRRADIRVQGPVSNCRSGFRIVSDEELRSGRNMAKKPSPVLVTVIMCERD